MTLHHVVLLIITIIYCDGYVKEDRFHRATEFADQMCQHDQVDFQTVTKSAVSCVRKCFEKPGCRSLVYLPTNETCFGIKSDNPFEASSSSLTGAIFYRSKNSQTTTSTPLQSTPVGPGTPLVVELPDSQFNASSFMTCCLPWNTRFNNDTGVHPWAANIQDTNQWLQVDFSQQIVAINLQTKGCGIGDWVTSYKVLTSTDCISFVTVTGGLGNDTMFPGNTDAGTVVENALELPVVFRCIRINPITWTGVISLHLEVLGHVI